MIPVERGQIVACGSKVYAGSLEHRTWSQRSYNETHGGLSQ